MSNPNADEAFVRHLQQIGLATQDQIEEARLLVAAGSAQGKTISLADTL
jgi:hypothetical protein